jgi:hypothetical protein
MLLVKRFVGGSLHRIQKIKKCNKLLEELTNGELTSFAKSRRGGLPKRQKRLHAQRTKRQQRPRATEESDIDSF